MVYFYNSGSQTKDLRYLLSQNEIFTHQWGNEDNVVSLFKTKVIQLQ